MTEGESLFVQQASSPPYLKSDRSWLGWPLSAQ